MYETVKNDPYIVDLYRQVEEHIDKNEGWAHHGMTHISNVCDMCGNILSQLGYDQSFAEETKIAAVLHDIGNISGKEGHALRSYLMAREYLNGNNIKLLHKDRIIKAIKDHSDCLHSDDMMTLTLIISDKLDLTKDRIARAGYKVRGMRQLQYIDDIRVLITEDFVTVDFIVDKKLDKDELEEFYFVDKVFKGVECFAKKIGRDHKIYIGGKEWNFNKQN